MGKSLIPARQVSALPLGAWHLILSASVEQTKLLGVIKRATSFFPILPFILDLWLISLPSFDDNLIYLSGFHVQVITLLSKHTTPFQLRLRCRKKLSLPSPPRAPAAGLPWGSLPGRQGVLGQSRER